MNTLRYSHLDDKQAAEQFVRDTRSHDQYGVSDRYTTFRQDVEDARLQMTSQVQFAKEHTDIMTEMRKLKEKAKEVTARFKDEGFATGPMMKALRLVIKQQKQTPEERELEAILVEWMMRDEDLMRSIRQLADRDEEWEGENSSNFPKDKNEARDKIVVNEFQLRKQIHQEDGTEWLDLERERIAKLCHLNAGEHFVEKLKELDAKIADRDARREAGLPPSFDSRKAMYPGEFAEKNKDKQQIEAYFKEQKYLKSLERFGDLELPSRKEDIERLTIEEFGFIFEYLNTKWKDKLYDVRRIRQIMFNDMNRRMAIRDHNFYTKKLQDFVWQAYYDKYLDEGNHIDNFEKVYPEPERPCYPGLMWEDIPQIKDYDEYLKIKTARESGELWIDDEGHTHFEKAPEGYDKNYVAKPIIFLNDLIKVAFYAKREFWNCYNDDSKFGQLWNEKLVNYLNDYGFITEAEANKHNQTFKWKNTILESHKEYLENETLQKTTWELLEFYKSWDYEEFNGFKDWAIDENVRDWYPIPQGKDWKKYDDLSEEISKLPDLKEHSNKITSIEKSNHIRYLKFKLLDLEDTKGMSVSEYQKTQEKREALELEIEQKTQELKDYCNEHNLEFDSDFLEVKEAVKERKPYVFEDFDNDGEESKLRLERAWYDKQVETGKIVPRKVVDNTPLAREISDEEWEEIQKLEHIKMKKKQIKIFKEVEAELGLSGIAPNDIEELDRWLEYANEIGIEEGNEYYKQFPKFEPIMTKFRNDRALKELLGELDNAETSNDLDTSDNANDLKESNESEKPKESEIVLEDGWQVLNESYNPTEAINFNEIKEADEWLDDFIEGKF